MTRATKVRLLAVLALAALTAASCGSGSGSAEGPHTSDSGPDLQQLGVVSEVPVAADFDPAAIFKWGYTIAPTSLDPHSGTSSDQNFELPAYDRLIYSAPSGELEPQLATSWSVNDDRTVISLQLRDGVTFQDGTTFDAAAVKINLDRARGETSKVKGDLASVTDVRVAGPLAVDIEVNGGAGNLLSTLSDRAGMMISPAAIASVDLNTKMVGAGPYELTEYRVGDRAIYKKYDGYWDPEIQRVAGMEIRIVSDTQARINALETGELSMAPVPVNEVDNMEKRGLGVLAGLGPQFIGFTMNAARPPFDNPLVRQAMFQAIDREGIADQLLEGLCEPQIQYWPSNSWAYDQELGNGLDVWPYDPERAAALLAEAGLADGFEFTAPITDLSNYVAIAEVMQANLADIGVTMNIELVDGPQLFQQFRIDKTADATLEVYVATSDPSGVMSRVLLPTAPGNPGALSNPRIVELSEEARSEFDQAKRAELYHELTAELIALVPSVGVTCMQYRSEAFRPNVSGISIYANGSRDFRGVAVSK